MPIGHRLDVLDLLNNSVQKDKSVSVAAVFLLTTGKHVSYVQSGWCCTPLRVLV